ncbi:DinB family protein [Humitalea sp. 24SJ18S-53]|uniref:DinB family protein n=1 Tax=Humitalea sp. 24SJ18S-53 TaxID=3422307 RepID=UPI003D6667F6
MITQPWVATMAAYNTEMNRRLYAAASRLTEAERRLDRGAFFGSIQGTLNHLLWGDTIWMSRFDGWAPPAIALRDSPRLHDRFEALSKARQDTDARIEAWAARVTPAFLAGETRYFSGALQREIQRPNGLLVTHVFNHQTHHRGQVHAMLTAAGQSTGDTDLVAMPGLGA